MKRTKNERLLPASLHQAIAELLPLRLEFYENWLRPFDLFRGTVGSPQLLAVLSFLREEGDDYDLVMYRAGEHAAKNFIENISGLTRSVACVLPVRWRVRVALRLCSSLVKRIDNRSRAMMRVKPDAVLFEIHGSTFCSIRGVVKKPLCVFYVVVLERVMDFLNVSAKAKVDGCCARGDEVCLVSVVVDQGTTG